MLVTFHDALFTLINTILMTFYLVNIFRLSFGCPGNLGELNSLSDDTDWSLLAIGYPLLAPGCTLNTSLFSVLKEGRLGEFLFLATVCLFRVFRG